MYFNYIYIYILFFNIKYNSKNDFIIYIYNIYIQKIYEYPNLFFQYKK